MADNELAQIIAVIAGGLVGSTILTLFPYFMGKGAIEKQQADIRAKPPEQRTPEEEYLLEIKYPGFWAEYKYRFSFGLLAGVASALASLNTGLEQVATMTGGQAFLFGLGTTGFFTALADRIRGAMGAINSVAISNKVPTLKPETETATATDKPPSP